MTARGGCGARQAIVPERISRSGIAFGLYAILRRFSPNGCRSRERCGRTRRSACRFCGLRRMRVDEVSTTKPPTSDGRTVRDFLLTFRWNAKQRAKSAQLGSEKLSRSIDLFRLEKRLPFYFSTGDLGKGSVPSPVVAFRRRFARIPPRPVEKHVRHRSSAKATYPHSDAKLSSRGSRPVSK